VDLHTPGIESRASALPLPGLGVDGGVENPVGAEATAIAPCSLACPLGINVQRYVGQAQRGLLLEALETILERCPLPGVCGYLCQRPCEAACRRGGVDRAVAIRWIKRAAVGAALAAGRRDRAPSPSGAAAFRVGVIGAGPAGLSAAWHLARHGHEVTVFERRLDAGGLLDEVVPDFRLPRRVLHADVARVLAHPLIELRAGVEVEPGELIGPRGERMGLAAVLVATGAGVEDRPRLDGAGAALGPDAGVLTPLEALRTLGTRKGPTVGGAALVMGSGAAAVAAARALRRAGWPQVTLLAGRSIDHWPADRQDLDAALADGVRLRDAFLVERVETIGARLTAVLGRRSEPDRLGRPAPAGDRERLEADLLVAEAPRRGRAEPAAEDGTGPRSLPRTVAGWMATDPVTLEAGRPGVFAAGECATGPKTVVEAMAAGLRAAAAIDRYVRGLPPAPPPSRRRPWLELAVLDGAEPDETPSPARPGQAIETPPSEAAAEARRCLRCGPCAECDRCDPSCRHERAVMVHADGRRLIYRAPAARRVDGALVARVDEGLCTGCGRCEATCPHQAVVVRFHAAGAQARAAVSRPACRGCGRCIPACPFGALDFAPGHGDGAALAAAAAREVRP
jgi:formate dehydrogenase major subunit